jgi:hypothetical protein
MFFTFPPTNPPTDLSLSIAQQAFAGLRLFVKNFKSKARFTTHMWVVSRKKCQSEQSVVSGRAEKAESM